MKRKNSMAAPLVKRSFAIGADQLPRLERLADTRRTSSSALMREALELYLTVQQAPRYAPPANAEQAAK